jgi:hypothetical protein
MVERAEQRHFVVLPGKKSVVLAITALCYNGGRLEPNNKHQCVIRTA